LDLPKLLEKAGVEVTFPLKLYGVVLAKCPRCGNAMDIMFESYREEGRTFMVLCAYCAVCSLKLCLDRPLVEVG